MKLANQVAIVTGSSSGIGRGVALAFAREGAAVVVNFPDDSQAAAGRSVRQEIEAGGGRAVEIQADVSNESDVDRLVSSALSAFSRDRTAQCPNQQRCTGRHQNTDPGRRAA